MDRAMAMKNFRRMGKAMWITRHRKDKYGRWHVWAVKWAGR